ncbi:uncharacterized protein Dwil_GK21976, isoform B [Drosophila willistoni]|uniref:GK21976 n=1 Tax=Drosophila willistoni TaxID=7260 RepID=B4MR10_DROWI|nr:uncharacterized protein LOC6640570 [Drosophila willistoni]XP_015034278.1 uncharacterized protein LOC6640570 [Drosophila willistoni]XP_023037746.1 uncharacterized protein LOC6640570 [Drosophila willistoni]XP_046866052.1 uncharacterized protein LOC6640570 [Drosophila willistoni]EDW74549.1 uncharacterized protein Dwil_GK21976, isoform A [Drosophila willistoni]KRF98025.1 uncharacterized protein Dwil_GK21976, isoform B [Drosophila willistoni]
MVSTRQMSGNAGSGNGNGSGGSNTDEQPGGQEEAATRTSVLRRFNQQQQQSAPTFLNGSNVATRHHSYNMQMQRSSGSSGGGAAGGASELNRMQAQTLTFLELPTELIQKTFEYLDYKNISQIRVVSHRVNDICMSMLNGAFAGQIKNTFKRFQTIKASMPRRESARRNHPLACECDIIETCYMRLSLLQMSMGKHIERGHCCFFPGSILDEVNSIMNYISITPRLQRPYRVTDELFDLSTMAMEYFKDRIEPTLPGLACFNKDFFQLPPTTKRPTLAIVSDLEESSGSGGSGSSSSSNSPPQNHMVLRKGIRKIKEGMRMYSNQLAVLRKDLSSCKRKLGEQGRQLAEQQNLLTEQQKQTLEYANRLDENDKKNEEMARKFSTLLQELNKCKTELQFWRSKSPAISSVCNACNQKVSPVLPPEDLQALVNQGVDPEHIIIINEDNDAESDVSGCELKEFASPDESTTAKLLAVNTATKNLKRKYPFVESDEDIEAIASTSKASEEQQLAASAMQQAAVATSGAIGGAGGPVEVGSNGGYSTKLFYGNHQRSGVIVSPVSMKMPHQQLQQQLAISGSSVTEEEPEESKKARRVQKANRCVNTHGKRSK